MLVDGLSFPQTRLERIFDRIKHWWSAPPVPPAPDADQEPPLVEVILVAVDDD